MVIFNKKECEYIKSFYNTEEEFNSETIQDYGDLKIKFSKASSTKYISTTNEELINFVLEKLKPYDVISIPEIKFMKYEVGDKLARHTDFSKYGVDVIFKTYLFQLSDSDEYVGGDLIVGNEVQSRTQGSMTIINPTTPHEVTPVIKGQRVSLVVFLREKNLSIVKSII